VHDILPRTQYLQFPKKIVFGVGAAAKIGEEVTRFKSKHVLLVTDAIIGRTEGFQAIQRNLANSGLSVSVYDRVEPEPRLLIAEESAQYAREIKPDVIVGVGGGSVLDIAKIMALAPTNPKKIRDYLGLNLVENPPLPKILAPTTSGTGSEVTNIAVVSLVEEQVKTSVVTPYNFADVAIVDPLLTTTMPPRTTVATGLDALSHAVEAYMSVESNPITDTLALKAIKLIRQHLPEAYTHPSNLQAREGMSLASLIAGMAFGNAGTCAGHAAAYAFAVKFKVPHGVSCALSLPYVMSLNSAAMEDKALEMAGALDIGTEGISGKVLWKDSISTITELMRELDQPLALTALGITEDLIPRLAEDMLRSQRHLARNPVKVTLDDATQLFQSMFKGEIG